MYTLITVLIFIICVLLVLIVLVQNSKGGGLASNFQASSQVMGVRKTADFLEKATWTLAGALLVLSIMGSAFIPRGEAGTRGSILQEQIQNVPDPTQIPAFPAPTGEEAPTATQDSAQ
ncbi:protein translocase subunit secG [Bacteroidales bacterium 6E]|nr:protein translocase subunit secG [Bacteroidales bacterium 6E]